MHDPARRAPTISFEFFPPKTPTAAQNLWRSVERLAPLGPQFVSVTYGAGGTTRERTLAAIAAIRERARLDVAGHLTCVGATREETLQVARSYRALGCARVVALRGDPPKETGVFAPHPDGFGGSVELIEALAREGGHRITVGAYPEKHPEAADQRADIDHLKRKLDAGAENAITQFFFENATFLRFRDACAKAGIDAPIIPGVLPVENFVKMRHFAEGCGASVPDWMTSAFENAADEEAARDLAVSIASEQCAQLLAEGASHLHVYTLNNPDLPFEVCRAIGFEPQPTRVAAAGGA
ncbi:methylenetetrahydrofolate reductase [NAD(P)H] [Rubrimonas cliftonensis]|uniref:Methylenetetrahydrofolate reductase n=1 Tax=Rubrimonas cliftonensis TaxID=89524 RepID=A0A1H3WRB0_9RHOB|nr:methylenetetrahydrofolate reductase [NAD(P)H] [Rubrimonas cliftonensis]SDZ89707.1 5,10-methylenetetrahydrofolate reductase (NAD(P)) [Rubrimonas cliftonensis]